LEAKASKVTLSILAKDGLAGGDDVRYVGQGIT
jgi:hypothetical protein